jgi:HTH-type transcriptional regulator, sugar sensing transcriptional regulator
MAIFCGVSPSAQINVVCAQNDHSGHRMDIEKVLNELGIEGSRAHFYLAALELGDAPVTAIAAKAGIGRSNSYEVLNRLASMGLVSQVEQEGKVHVIAEDPSVLLRRLEQQRMMVTAVLPDLLGIHNRSRSKPRIRFFQGEEGIRAVLWDTLSCRAGPLRGILSMQELLETPGHLIMEQYIQARVKIGLHFRVIRSHTRDTEAIWPTSVEELRQLRYAPANVSLAMTSFMYNDTVSFISSKRELYGILIQSQEFHTLQETLFESLWAISQGA